MMLTAEARQCCGYGRLFPKRAALRLCAWLSACAETDRAVCAACAALLVRFVAATDADGVAWAVPDASGRLPGRGAYTLASPRAVDLAVSNSACLSDSPSPLLLLTRRADGFTRQMKRPVVGMPDLPRRTEAALVTHLAEFARNVAVPQLPPPPGAASSKSRRRQPPAGAGEAEHEWRLCLWAHGDDASTPPAEPAPFPDEALEPPVPVGARSAVRVLFALRRGELEATLGAEGVAAWQSTAVRLPARASAALSAAQWRLEGFRPAARPPGLRASGEAPAGWTPPAEDADSASA